MMRKTLGAVVAVVMFACGSPSGTGGTEQPTEGLTLTVEAGATHGTFVDGEHGEAKFSSREVEPGVYRIEVRLRRDDAHQPDGRGERRLHAGRLRGRATGRTRR